jgi:alanyl-tRNA synthetase
LKRLDEVKEILTEEELSFSKTLDRGERLFENLLKQQTGGIISGLDAFRLYDTYGFPIDLTRLMAAPMYWCNAAYIN